MPRTFNIKEPLTTMPLGSVMPVPPGSAFMRSLVQLVGARAATKIATTAGVDGAYRMSTAELAEVAAVPLRVAERVAAARELAFAHQPDTQPIVCTHVIAAAHLPPEIATLEVEVLLALVLGAKYELKATVLLAKGSVSSTYITMRDIFVPLARLNATAFVLVHNHPSGTEAPSEDDIHLTNKVAEVAAMLAIPLVDHLIVARNEIVSFDTLGLMPDPSKEEREGPSSQTRPRRRT